MPPLPYFRLQLQWHCQQPTALPLGFGEALRGFLGRQLAVDAPAAYGQLFPCEGGVGARTPSWNIRYKPHDQRRESLAGEILLFGAHMAYVVPSVIRALEHVPSLHISRQSQPLPSLGLVALAVNGEPAHGSFDPLYLPDHCQSLVDQACGLELLQPLLMDGSRTAGQQRRRPITAAQASLGHLVQAAAWRVHHLAFAVGIDWPVPEIDPAVRTTQAESADFVDAHFLYKGRRRPGIQGQAMWLDLPPLYQHILAATCLTNCGRSALVGAGVTAPLAALDD